MLRSKKTAYVTIGNASAVPAAPAAEGVDALACEQESAAIYAATEPLKSLVEVRSAGAARVLVVDAGTRIRYCHGVYPFQIKKRMRLIHQRTSSRTKHQQLGIPQSRFISQHRTS